MQTLLRLVMILVLAAFAGGSFTHTVAASTMAFEMVTAEPESMGMDDCKACDHSAMKTGKLACDVACDMAFAATLPELAQFGHPQISETHSVQHETLVGRTPPLGRSPPRTIFLI